MRDLGYSDQLKTGTWQGKRLGHPKDISTSGPTGPTLRRNREGIPVQSIPTTTSRRIGAAVALGALILVLVTILLAFVPSGYMGILPQATPS